MATIEVDYDPISINSGPVTVDINGLNDIQLAVTQPIKADLTVKVPDPIKTDSKIKTDSDIKTRSELHTDSKISFTIPEPIRTDSRAELDLRPIAVDQCLRLSLAPLPATRICLPNRQHVGITLFGVEVFGLTLEGEAQVLVGEPHRQAHIIGPGEYHGEHHGEHHGDHHEGGGLRVRLSV